MTDKQLKVKKWLNRAFDAEKKVKALGFCVQQCRERAESISVCYGNNDKSKSDGSTNVTENILIRLADAEMELSKQIIELLNISDEIKETIAKLQDDSLETIMIHRYILFHTVEKTAELTNYSVETVKRKQRQAIEKLTPFDTF